MREAHILTFSTKNAVFCKLTISKKHGKKFLERLSQKNFFPKNYLIKDSENEKKFCRIIFRILKENEKKFFDFLKVFCFQ